MNQSITNTIVKDQEKNQTIITNKLTELKNVLRLASNTINLINDSDFKGAYAQPIAEVMGWLNGIKTSVEQQIKTLEDTLPKEDVVIPEIVS